MVKECKVILNNKEVTVVNYDGTMVQLPPIKMNASVVNVLYKDGKYSIASNKPDNYPEPKRTKKKKNENTYEKKENENKKS